MKQLTPRINILEQNIVIDGGMEIWPEWTSRVISSGAQDYSNSLMKMYNSNSGASVTVSRQTDVPLNSDLVYSNRTAKTGAGSLASNTFVMYDHYIEGSNLRRIIKDEFTVVFWVKSSVASTRSVNIRNGTTTHTYLKNYTIDAANTWELKALKFPAMNTCPGALNRTNGIGIILSFPIVVGSSFQNATTDSWIAGNFYAGVGQDTTWLTGTTHDFNITGLMLLPGDWTGITAATYRFVGAGKDNAEETAKVQRWFNKSMPMDVPALNNTGDERGAVANLANVTGPFHFQFNIEFPVIMRAVPSVTFIGIHQNNINFSNLSANNDGGTTGALTAVGDTNFAFGNAAAFNTSGVLMGIHWKADARF